MRILGVVSSSSREVPNAPTIGTATDVGTGRAYNNGAATVTFTAPTWTGGLPITGYTVTSSPGGFTGTGASSPITVTGLQSNTAYTFTVRATNAVGQSAASTASNSITATTVPQAPTIGTATAGNAQATVTFTAGANGGKAVSTFTSTSSPAAGSGSSATSPITHTGLTNGTAYTFTVTATNANGTSTASSASNSVTPALPPVSVDYIVVAGGGSGTFSFSSGYLVGAGGGAGGYLAGTLSVPQGVAQTVTIGAGGAASSPAPGGINRANGSNSVFSSITATGGGSAGYSLSTSPYTATNFTGGSAGGNNFYGVQSGVSPSPAGQGNASGGSTNSASNGGSGGGGAGSRGADGSYSAPYGIGGFGGRGITENLTGTSIKLAGGANGNGYGILASNPSSPGTADGYLYGAAYSSRAGAAPSGTSNWNPAGANQGGGGISRTVPDSVPTVNPQNGGSGVVIVACASAATATTGSPATGTYNGKYWYRFTGSGSITF